MTLFATEMLEDNKLPQKKKKKKRRVFVKGLHTSNILINETLVANQKLV